MVYPPVVFLHTCSDVTRFAGAQGIPEADSTQQVASGERAREVWRFAQQHVDAESDVINRKREFTSTAYIEMPREKL